MSLRPRLAKLERRIQGIRWCRCPFDREQSQAETAEAMRTGEPTPSECANCGGARIAIQYVSRDKPLPGASGATIAVTLDLGRTLDPAVEAELSRRRDSGPTPEPAPSIENLSEAQDEAEPVAEAVPPPQPYDDMREWMDRMHAKRARRGW
jgi:hypothetical protein